MERRMADIQKLAPLAREAPPCLLGWLAAATPGRALKPRKCRYHVQNAFAHFASEGTCRWDCNTRLLVISLATEQTMAEWAIGSWDRLSW